MWVRGAEVMRKKGARTGKTDLRDPKARGDFHLGPCGRRRGATRQSHRNKGPIASRLAALGAPLGIQGSAAEAWRALGGGPDARESAGACSRRGVAELGAGGPHRPREMAPPRSLAEASPWGAELPALHQPRDCGPFLSPRSLWPPNLPLPLLPPARWPLH